MLVSGKNVIAIDGVKTGNTLKGDGVFNTPGSKLDVNTDIIATKEFVTAEDEEVVGKINAASATLSSKIDSVSSKLTTSAETLSANKQDKLEFEGDHNRITAIGPSGGTLSSVGGNVVDVKAGNSTTVTTATDEETGITTYTVSLTAEPTDTIVSGENGITSRQNGNTFFVGLSSTYENAIKKVSSISADVTALSSYKLDATAYKPETFYPMEGNPSGFLTAHQSLSSYYTKQQVDNKFTATSSWANTTFLTKNSADGLYYPLNTNPNGYLTESDISADKWNSVYTTVNTASGSWNLISSVSALAGIQNFKQLLIYKEGQQGVQYTIEANGSAASLLFVQGDNISLTTAGESIKLSAKDTTYTSGNYIVISGDNNSINAVGLQPSGDYVSATDFNEFKDKVEDEFEQTSAWVKENFLSANALDEIKNLSAKWDAASDEVTSHSANWNSVYETVQTNSGDWEEITKVKTFKTIGGIDAETSADSLEFSAGENIKIGVTEDKKIYISSHDTTYDENDFISASHLDNIVSVSANVTANSADWTSAARALEASADKWNTTHEQFNTSSVKWNELYDEYQVSSKLWNDTTDAVNTFSGDWNEVSAKANSADLVELSGKVETLSSELETASAFIEGQIVVLSGDIDDISDDIEYISGDVEKKLYTEDFKAWSAEADITPYSAGKGLALNGHEFYVSADYAMSADVYSKDEVDEKIAKFGGYTTANADESGYPDVAEPSTKFIYLVKMSGLPASSDNYKEWIYTSTEQTTAWECVGETTLDLTPYLTKEEAAHTYQPSGYYVTSSTNEISAVDEYYGLIKDSSDNVQWAKIPVRDTTYTAGKNIVISGNDNEISVSGLHNTIVSSQNGSIAISSIPDANGNITYNLSVQTVPDISGTNGVSAYYDEGEDQYVVGLEEHLYNYAEAQSQTTTITSQNETVGNFENVSLVGHNIVVGENSISLEKGLYHIDLQVNVNINSVAATYYDVELSNSLSNGALTKVIDGSYAHTETLDLSFDVKLVNASNTLTFTLKNMPTGSTYYVKNLQIHEITTIDSVIETVGGVYTGGDAIAIDSENHINVKYDSLSGIGITNNNELYVKLGKGLSFSNEGGVDGSLTLDDVTEEVVETVQSLKVELDNKLTTNMNISDAKDIGSMFRNDTVASLGCSLFTVPLQHNLTTATELSFFTTQGLSQNTSFPIIFGILEYNFDYFDPETHQYRSQTKWIGDTGPIFEDTLDVKGHAVGGGANKYTFKLKHLTPVVSEDIDYDGKTYHNEVGPVLRSDRAYYLAVFARHTNGLNYVLGDAGYNAVTNSDPYISWYGDNLQYVVGDTSATMDDNWGGWYDDLSLEHISYWNRGGEANGIVRPLVMIRNVSE